MSLVSAPDAALDPHRFRSSVSRFATGIAIVSCFDEQGQPHGMTISSFTSISLEPPTVLVSLRPGRTHDRIRRQGRYGVSILGTEHESWSRHFSGHPQPGLAPVWDAAAHVPVLRDALAWFECQVDELLQVHDHTLFVARVTACGHTGGAPLMFFASGYHRALDHSPISQDRRA
jgi:flavin reductase (DIM6/NTAB) family NADH-FMN oxidoreductase RutF